MCLPPVALERRLKRPLLAASPRSQAGLLAPVEAFCGTFAILFVCHETDLCCLRCASLGNGLESCFDWKVK